MATKPALLRSRYKKLQIVRDFLCRMLVRAFWVFPVKQNRIFALSHHETGYNCSPKALTDLLQPTGKYDIVWSLKEPENSDFAGKKISAFSFRRFYYLATARLFLTNCVETIPYAKRTGQLTLNTWHGGGSYKRSTIQQYGDGKSFDNIFVSSCGRFTEQFLLRDCHFTGKILSTGLPRNDIFFDPARVEEANQIVRKFFNIPEQKKIILYAPTFRETRKVDVYDIAVEPLLGALQERFGAEFVFAFRSHYYLKKKQGTLPAGTINMSSYPDMQQLLCAADVLITDYSSSIWDFSLLYRPGFLYATDMESYIDERDFYTPVEKWQYPLCQSNEELLEAVRSFDTQKNKERIEEHHRFMESFETGHACEAVISEIESICQGANS